MFLLAIQVPSTHIYVGENSLSAIRFRAMTVHLRGRSVQRVQALHSPLDAPNGSDHQAEPKANQRVHQSDGLQIQEALPMLRFGCHLLHLQRPSAKTCVQLKSCFEKRC